MWMYLPSNSIPTDLFLFQIGSLNSAMTVTLHVRHPILQLQFQDKIYIDFPVEERSNKNIYLFISLIQYSAYAKERSSLIYFTWNTWL